MKKTFFIVLLMSGVVNTAHANNLIKHATLMNQAFECSQINNWLDNDAEKQRLYKIGVEQAVFTAKYAWEDYKKRPNVHPAIKNLDVYTGLVIGKGELKAKHLVNEIVLENAGGDDVKSTQNAKVYFKQMKCGQIR